MSLFGVSLDLPVFQLNRSKTPEDGDRNLQLTPLRVDLIDSAGQTSKGTVSNFHFLANNILNLRNFLPIGRFDSGPDFNNFRGL